jgi:hypothetical protein
MKKIALVFSLSILCVLGCVDDDVDPSDDPNQKGCATGIPDNSTTDERVFIICCTRAQAQGGSNTAAGGLEIFKNYTGLKWTAVEDCAECQ